VRLAEAQRRGLRSPGERLRATVEAFVSAVEAALADEHLLDRPPEPLHDDALAAARAAAEAAAVRYEAERAGAS
jgi:hypothetical protein